MLLKIVVCANVDILNTLIVVANLQIHVIPLSSFNIAQYKNELLDVSQQPKHAGFFNNFNYYLNNNIIIFKINFMMIINNKK